MGQQSRTFGCFLLNRTLCTFLIEFVQIVCVHTVVLAVSPPGERRVLTQPILGWRPSPLKGLWEETRHTAGLHPDTRLLASSVRQRDLSELMHHAF